RRPPLRDPERAVGRRRQARGRERVPRVSPGTTSSAIVPRRGLPRRARRSRRRDHTSLGLLPEGPRLVIRPPSPAVLELIQRSWNDVRKRARVLLVLDTSGSMSGTKLDLMKRASIDALDQFADDDEVGLWSFSSRETE